MNSRREFLQQTGWGFGSLALAAMMFDEADASKSQGTDGVLRELHHPAKAKRVVQLFMAGAASHIDMFDHKPALEKHHGEPSDFGEHVEAFQDGLGPWMKSPFAFKPYGECGKMLSDIVAPLGEVVDDMAFVHNLVGKTGVHSQATYLQSTGFDRPGFPGMGAWISYGLGSLTNELPSFVVLPDHRGYASNGPKNWGSAFLPASTQGTTIFPQRENPIEDLHAKSEFVTADSDRDGLALLNRLNAEYSDARPGDSRLEARIRSYELAAKMQLAAPRGSGHLAGASAHPQDVRRRSTGTRVSGHNQCAGGDGVLRTQVPHRAAPAGAGREVRADLVGQRQQLPPPQLGQP